MAGAGRFPWDALLAAVPTGEVRVSLSTGRSAPLTVDPEQLIREIEAGVHDKWLEAILAAGHDRKRTKRGTLGFPRRLP